MQVFSTQARRRCIWLLIAFGATAAGACPIKPPEGLVGVSVGENLVVDGLPVSILQVESRLGARAMVQKAEQAWHEAGYETRRHPAGEWLVVSAATESCLTTLQLVERNGATGYLSVSRPQKWQAAVPKSLRELAPDGWEVDSAIQSADQGRRGLTAVLGASQIGDAARDAWLRRLTSSGWQAVSAHRVRKPKQQLSADRITAQKGRQLVSVVIWSDAQLQQQRRARAVLNLSDVL